MRNNQQDDDSGRVDEFGGQLAIALTVVILIVLFILFNSTSPRTGVASAAAFLIAIGFLVMAVRKLVR